MRRRNFAACPTFFDVGRVEALELEKGQHMAPWVAEQSSVFRQTRVAGQHVIITCMRAWATNLKQTCFRRLRLHATKQKSLARLSRLIGNNKSNRQSPARYYLRRWMRNHLVSKHARHRREQLERREALAAMKLELAASKARIVDLRARCDAAREREEQVEGM